MFQKIYVSWLPLHHLDHLQDWKRDMTTQSVIIWDKKKKKRFSRNPSRTNSTEMHQWLNSVFHFPEFKEQKSHRWIIFANHFWTSQSECAKNTIQLLLWSLFWPLCRAFFEESREDTSCIISNSRWKLYVLLLTENGPFKIMKDI